MENYTPSTIPLQPTAFVDLWPTPSEHLMRPKTPPAPNLDVGALLPPGVAQWVRNAAESRSCPVDFVVAALLTTTAAAIGNSRVVSPKPGWTEPSSLWTMLVGHPSSGKSPALDSVLAIVRKVERGKAAAAKKEIEEHSERAAVAALREKQWKKEVSEASKIGAQAPAKPDDAKIEDCPEVPRLVISDATVEVCAKIIGQQERLGALLIRDELAGWLGSMEKYNGGGGPSDRAFWLESYGGRSYVVERIGRPSVVVNRLLVSVSGCIQPGRLDELLLDSTDDGLVARFLPFWPEPVDITDNDTQPDNKFLENILLRLYAWEMTTTDTSLEPVIIPFSEEARRLHYAFRNWVQSEEKSHEGLLVSLLGKLPGLSARLSLAIAALEAAEKNEALVEISADQFARIEQFLKNYMLPMVKRCYGIGVLDAEELKAVRLINLFRQEDLREFTGRELNQRGLKGLRKAAELKPVLHILEDNGIVRSIQAQTTPLGGRPSQRFAVNPAIFDG